MTHEYLIATGGTIGSPGARLDDHIATAIGWAADHVLAVGPDAVVRAISRGDSTFLDLGGCIVTALPADLARAEAVMAEAIASSSSVIDVQTLLIDAGLLTADDTLEPGSPADLAFWDVGPRSGNADPRSPSGLVAVVHKGAFTEGDEHYGPFPAAESG